MSELEKRQRDEYQKNRKKWIFIEMIVAAALVLATILTFIPYTILNNNTYVYYAEDGKTTSRVYLADNSFYNENYLDESHAYVASLVDSIKTDFKYGMKLDTDRDVEYRYSYSINATVNVIDRDSKAPLYDPVEELITPVKDAVTDNNALYIAETVDITYSKYNDLAKKFVDEYGISDATANLTIRMNVQVLGKSETLAEDKNNSYSMEVVIPLLKQTLKMTTQSSVPEGEQKILACDTVAKTVLLVLWIVFLCLSVLACAFIVVFVILTRDKHIDYSRRVQKLLSSYKSYIQRITTPFDFEGYKVLGVMTFAELLEIGDKLQNPVLMYENEDKTRSDFFVATANNIIYLYTVEVEEDDEPLDAEPVIEETVAEPVIEEAVAEPVIEEPVEEAVVPTVDEEAESISVVPALNINSRFKRSFMSKLIQAEGALQDYYSEVKNELLSYKGVKARTSWSCESFNKGRIQLAKMTIRGKTLVLYLALVPAEFEESRYHHTDSSDSSRYVEVPFTLKIRSARALKYAKELIAVMMANIGIEKSADFEAVDYHMPYETTKALVAEGLIKYDGDINELPDEIIEEPAEEVTEEPAEEVTEEPAEEVTEEPTEEVIEEPAEEVTEEPAEEVTEEPTEEVTEEPAEEVIEEPAEEVTEEPAEEVIEEPAEEITEEPAEEVAEEADNGSNEESTEESTEELTEEPTEELAEEPTEELTEELTEESTEELAEELPIVVLEQSVGEAVEQSEEQPAEEQPAEEQSVEEQPAEEQPAEEQPAEEQPAEEQPAEEQPAEEQPAEEQPVEEQPAEEQPAEENTVEAISVKWNAKDKHTYRYDPNGAIVDEGDTVLVPTMVPNVGEIEREAQVARGNYRIPADELNKPLKKIIAVVRRKMQSMVAPSDDKTQK